MESIQEKFRYLNNLASTITTSKKSTENLLLVEQYLSSELDNTDLCFSENEFKFSGNVNYYLSNSEGFIDRYLPFLISKTKKLNISLLKKIKKLFEEKNLLIKSIYEKDVKIVDAYMEYAKSMMRSGELFFYEPDFENIPWAKKGFPNNMFRYLSFKIRTNPKCLNENYIEMMKGHFTFFTLGLDDKEKVVKINQYFAKANDPFSPDIPSKYDDVRAEIRMLLPMVLSSEKLFLEIVADVKEKYA